MASQRRDLRPAALNLIRAASELLQEESTILASIEECDYFRSIYRSARDIAPQQNLKDHPKITLHTHSGFTNPDRERQGKVAIEEKISSPVDGFSAEPHSKAVIPEQPFKGPNEPILAKPALNDNSSESLIKTPEALPKEPEAAIRPIADPLAISAPAAIEPSPRMADMGFGELQKLLSKIAPELVFLEQIPSDAKARQIAQRWKTKNQSAPISLLFLHEPLQQQKFLTNLATALDVVFGPARLINAEGIEKESQWEAFLSVAELKLVIICDYALWQMPHLLKYYREVPNQTQRFLLNKPLMLLPDLTLYLKDPQLKRSLWKAICQKIGSL